MESALRVSGRYGPARLDTCRRYRMPKDVGRSSPKFTDPRRKAARGCKVRKRRCAENAFKGRQALFGDPAGPFRSKISTGIRAACGKFAASRSATPGVLFRNTASGACKSAFLPQRVARENVRLLSPRAARVQRSEL